MTLALEWHFNNYDGNEAKIREFAVYDGGNMVRFKAGRPTSSGFGQLPRFMSRLSGEQVQAVGVLDQLRCSERTRSFTFRLDQSALTMKDKLELNNIYDRLPGGNPKMLLPSIGRREYTAFPGGQHNLPIYGSHEHEIDAMIKASPPFPMVPLPAADEFATLREAAAELSMASTITERERNEALRLWANPESPHQATLYALDELPLIGIKFGGYNLLQGTDKFTLPEHLYADITIVLPGTVGVEFAAFHYPSSLGLPKHDAYFVITSVDGSRFRQLCRNVKAELTDLKAGNSAPKHSKATERQSFAVKIKPHYNSFTCHGQLKTLQLLCQNGTNQRWHRILLNQQHYAIVEVDMTKDAEVSEKEEEEAYQQLVNFMPWNAEQMEVIEGIRTAPDGMQIVLGPAGTGKVSSHSCEACRNATHKLINRHLCKKRSRFISGVSGITCWHLLQRTATPTILLGSCSRRPSRAYAVTVSIPALGISGWIRWKRGRRNTEESVTKTGMRPARMSFSSCLLAWKSTRTRRLRPEIVV